MTHTPLVARPDHDTVGRAARTGGRRGRRSRQGRCRRRREAAKRRFRISAIWH